MTAMSSITPQNINIVLVDDDPEDCEMIEQALKHCKIKGPIHTVHNGVALLVHLE